MQSVEFTLPAKVWQGLNTKYPADTKLVDADQFTDGSINLLTNPKGIITKRSGGVYYNPTPFPTPAKDQYEAVFSSGVRHLLIVENGNLRYSSGGGVFNLVTSGYASTGNFEFASYKNRVYFGNGIDDPQVYDTVPNYGGVPYTVPQTRVMGVQLPVTPVTFAADTAGGAVPAGAHTYKVTFLYYDSEESNGGPASAVHTVANPNNTVNLTAVPIGGYGVTARKIYRDNNDGNWLLVGTITNNTAVTFTDTSAIGTLPIPTNNGNPPRWSLVVNHRDRLWVAGVTADPSTIYWSEAGLPDIFFTNNRLLCNPKDPITGLAVYNDRVIVFNRNSMGQILGSTSADYRYAEISPSIGCVDNRSIATRTIQGVPKLIWLAGIDMYEFNGSSISPISDEIDDQFQFNIQQALQVKGQNTQSSQADFLAGTSSPGIELMLNPGNITTKGYTGTTNPTKIWDTESEWENGSSLTNISTNDGTNTLKAPTLFAPTLASGTLSGSTQISGSNLTLPATTDYTGEARANGAIAFPVAQPTNTQASAWAQPFIPTRSGTLNSVQFQGSVQGSIGSWTFNVWTSSGGIPSTVLFSQAMAGNIFQTWTFNPNVVLTAGQTYFFGVLLNPFPNGPFVIETRVRFGTSNWTGGHALTKGFGASINTWGNALSWQFPGPTNDLPSVAGTITFTSSPIPSSGGWTSAAYDTFSDSISTGLSLTNTATYQAGTTATVQVQGTNSLAGVPVWTTTDTLLNPSSGSHALTGSGFRYWRIVVGLATPDNRFIPTIGSFVLRYNITGIWISEVIDHTSDVISLDALTASIATPPFTSVLVEIATSANNITYTAFTSLGSAVVQRYSKIRITLTSFPTDDTTPTVNSLLFSWSLTANLISQVIDTGTVPAGWDLFQDTHSSNGGTVLFEMRTASTIPGLTGATWFTQTNGAFITAPVFQYAQWRVTITSHANQVPLVESVTVNWLIQNVASIRVASLFYKKQYYLAAAEFDQTVNNIVFIYDENNTWKVFRGLNINTMGTFFSDAYYGSSIVGQMVKWLDPAVLTDQGTDIAMDVRTKAFSNELGDETKAKMVRQLTVKVLGTGAEITPFYSLDEGTTFIPMIDIETGLPSYITNNDGRLVTIRFSALSGQLSSGRTIMFRLFTEDEFAVELHSMRAKCWISPREVLHG